MNNDGGMYDGAAKVLAFETNGDYTYVASDATALYGKKCTEAVRQFVYLPPDTFVVYDRVGAADPSDRKAWLLHVKDEPRIDGKLLVADSGKGQNKGMFFSCIHWMSVSLPNRPIARNTTASGFSR